MKISDSVITELKSVLTQKKLPGAHGMPQFKELAQLTRDKIKIKMEMDRKSQEAALAEREAEASLRLSASFLNSIEDLRKKVDDLNAEQVLVEIARLDAESETREIEERRFSEAKEFSQKIMRIRDRKKMLEKEISRSGEAIERELEAAKREQAEMKAEGFRLMRSMDKARAELVQTFRERERLEQLEKKTDLTLRSINSKLVKARSKKDAALASEEQTRLILQNLSSALQQLRSEAENARNEKENTEEEIRSAKDKIMSMESDLESKDLQLENAIEGLRIAKTSENTALAKLKRLSERTMEIRACAASRSSAIRMSAFEYEYLKSKAEEARRVADLKAEAASAWIEAFRISTEEILLKIETAKKDLAEIEAREMNLEAEVDLNEEEMQTTNSRRRSMKENTMRVKSRSRRSISYGQRPFQQSPAVVLKRKKVMPGLSKLLRRGNVAEESL